MEKKEKSGIDLMVERDSKGSNPSPWYYIMGGVWVKTNTGVMRAGGELVKKRKPCMAGDYVHLHCWNGCYRVLWASVNGFCIMRNRKEVVLSWDKFRCLKGEGRSQEKDVKVIKRTLKNMEKGTEDLRRALEGIRRKAYKM